MTNPTRAWVLMPSGKRLDLLNPSPLQLDDVDITTALSRTYRWGGHSSWPLPLSVAQHSLLVAAICRELAPNNPRLELLACAHEVDEILGFDAITPLKPFLGENFAMLSDQLFSAGFERLDIEHWTAEEKAIIKKADVLAAASEAIHVVGWSPAEVHDVLEIKATPLDCDPLAESYGGTPWEPWPPRAAAERLLSELRRLKAQLKVDEAVDQRPGDQLQVNDALMNMPAAFAEADGFDVPLNCIILNSPRPIVGNLEPKDCSHWPAFLGRHYALIDRQAKDAGKLIEANKRLGAAVILPVAQETIDHAALTQVPERYREKVSGLVGEARKRNLLPYADKLYMKPYSELLEMAERFRDAPRNPSRPRPGR